MPTSPRGGRTSSPFGRVPRVATLAQPSHQVHPDVLQGKASKGSCTRCHSGHGHGHSHGRNASPRGYNQHRTLSPQQRGRSRTPTKSRAFSPSGTARNVLTNPKWVAPVFDGLSQAPRTIGRNKTIDPEWGLSTEPYPNWTLGEEQKVKRLPPNRDASPPNAGTASPRRPEKVELTSQMEAYPNWTLGEEAKRPASPLKSRVSFGNNDIEGSKPALRQFRKHGQRIVADPYPETLSCPIETGWNRERTNTITPWRNISGQAPGRYQSPDRSALYDRSSGTLRTKEVEVFKDGHYQLTEVRSPRVVEDSGLGVSRDSRPVTVPRTASPRASRGSSSLRTSDIEGAQARPFQTPTRSRGGSMGGRAGGSVSGVVTPPNAVLPSPRTSSPGNVARAAGVASGSGSPAARQRPTFTHDRMMHSQISFF